MTIRAVAIGAMSCALLLTAACSQAADEEAGPEGSPADTPAETAPDTDDVEQADAWTPARTPWGEPDIQGMWPVGHLTWTPLQRPAEFGDRLQLTDEEYAARQAMLATFDERYATEDAQNKMGMGHWAETGDPNRLTSLIVDPSDGQLPPLTEEGERRSAEMRSSWQNITFDWVTDFDSWDRCITRGMPASMFPFQYNNGIRIFQAPGVVVLQLEMIHETRVIPTDGRPVLSPAILQWLGESRGRWEGDTLVVETENFRRGPSAVNGGGVIGAPGENKLPMGETSRVVERFTRTGLDTLDYEMTFEDPELYVAPWTVKMPWRRDQGYEMFEYACHEGQYMIRDYINASRAGRASQGAEE